MTVKAKSGATSSKKPKSRKARNEWHFGHSERRDCHRRNQGLRNYPLGTQDDSRAGGTHSVRRMMTSPQSSKV